MVNSSGTEPLVYLCVSTRHAVEIVEYPDSRKIGANFAQFAGSAHSATNWRGRSLPAHSPSAIIQPRKVSRETEQS
jgi:uncharacterized cupin superfamily protein